MSAVPQVLHHILTIRFYRTNTGFFLLLFLLLFGIADPGASIRFHHGIMLTMAARPATLAAGCAVWTLYSAKCIRYCLGAIGRPQQQALFYLLQGIAARRRQWLFLSCIFALYLPALLYAGCAASVALSVHQPMAFAIIAAQQLAALAAGVWCCDLPVRRAAIESRLGTYLYSLRRRLKRPVSFYQYLLAYTLQRKKTALLLLKTVSLLLLQLMVAINKEKLQGEGTYFFLLLIVTGHSMLPYQYTRFMEGNAWLRNLPLRWWQRYACYAVTYAVLLLPELCFLLLHTQGALHISTIVSLYALALGLLCWLQTATYYRQLTAERYPLFAFAALLLTMLLLTSVSVWALAAGWLSLSLLLFPVLYKRYERPLE